MSVIKLGIPAIPVKITEYGTCFGWDISAGRLDSMPNKTATR